MQGPRSWGEGDGAERARALGGMGNRGGGLLMGDGVIGELYR